MITGAPVLFRISPEAAGRLNQLGLQRDCDAMREHAQQVVPDLRVLEVTLEDDPEESREPTLAFNMYRSTGTGDDPTPRQWRAWMALTFPPEVCQHFALVTIYE